MNKNLFDEVYQYFVGFDDIPSRHSGYPPYNVERSGDKYRIVVAVAGFSEGDLNVERDKDYLRITGAKSSDGESEFEQLYKGIATRNFKLAFLLDKNMVIDGAELKDGLLTVSLHYLVPESERPKTIVINAGHNG